MKKFLSTFFVLASAAFIASLLLDRFTGVPITLRTQTVTMLVVVSLAQTAMLQSLRLFRPKPDENPDQHR
jgi:hypothetical protein